MKKLLVMLLLAAMLCTMAFAALAEDETYPYKLAWWNEEEGFYGIMAIPEKEPEKEDNCAGFVEYFAAWGPDTPKDDYTGEEIIIPINY